MRVLFLLQVMERKEEEEEEEEEEEINTVFVQILKHMVKIVLKFTAYNFTKIENISGICVKLHLRLKNLRYLVKCFTRAIKFLTRNPSVINTAWLVRVCQRSSLPSTMKSR